MLIEQFNTKYSFKDVYDKAKQIKDVYGISQNNPQIFTKTEIVANRDVEPQIMRKSHSID